MINLAHRPVTVTHCNELGSRNAPQPELRERPETPAASGITSNAPTF